MVTNEVFHNNHTYFSWGRDARKGNDLYIIILCTTQRMENKKYNFLERDGGRRFFFSFSSDTRRYQYV